MSERIAASVSSGWTEEEERRFVELLEARKAFRDQQMRQEGQGAVVAATDDDAQKDIARWKEIETMVRACDDPSVVLECTRQREGMEAVRAIVFERYAEDDPERALAMKEVFYASIDQPLTEGQYADSQKSFERTYKREERKRIIALIASCGEEALFEGIRRADALHERFQERLYVGFGAVIDKIAKTNARLGLDALAAFIHRLPLHNLEVAKGIAAISSYTILKELGLGTDAEWKLQPGETQRDLKARLVHDPRLPLPLQIALLAGNNRDQRVCPSHEARVIFEAAESLPYSDLYQNKFTINDFAEQERAEIRTPLFHAYRAQKNTHGIFTDFETFLPDILELPQREQENLLMKALLGIGYYLPAVKGLVANGVQVTDRMVREMYSSPLFSPARKAADLEQFFSFVTQPLPADAVVLKNLTARLQDIIIAKPTEALEVIALFKDRWPSTVPFPKFPWIHMYERLEKVQGRAAREEYDPWKTDLTPLLASASRERLIDGQRAEDAEVVFDFVKVYGMKNLPTLFRWHVALLKAKTVEDLPEEVKREIQDTMRIKLSKLKNKGLVTAEIKRFMEKVRKALLEDEECAGLQTPVGVEIVLALIGSTQWRRDDDLAQLIATSVDTLRSHPELKKNPEYKTVTFEVPLLERRRLTAEEQVAYENACRVHRENPDVQQDIDLLQARFGAALQEDPAVLSALHRSTLKASLVRAREEVIASSGAAPDRLEMIRVYETLEGRLQALPAKSTIKDLLTIVVDLPEPLLQTMEDWLGEVTAAHLLHGRGMMTEAQKTTVTDLTKTEGEPLTKARMQGWADILTGLIEEHYLNTQQTVAHTRHIPFPPALLSVLRRTWRVEGKPDDLPLVHHTRALSDLERRTLFIEGKKKIPVSLVPVKGVLRTFAGDVGDACYTSKHQELARGDYPDMTAYLYVTNLGTPKERIRGSLLAIETAKPTGEKVLLVRANNPQDALLQQVDATQLITKTLSSMQDLAQRLDTPHTVVPRSRHSRSSSNRPPVSEYYRRLFAGQKTVPLVKSPETTFNGYDVWNPMSLDAVVDIDLRDDVLPSEPALTNPFER